jgi:ketosteroid isomerase-like protein
MSQENVEVVRRVIEAFNAAWERGNPTAFDRAAHIAPDAEWIPAPELVGPAVYRGADGWIKFMRTWTEDFEDWSSRVERLIDAGENRVVALLHQSGTGKGSGAPVDLHHGSVFELEDGRITRMRVYGTTTEALEAAGLRE